MSLTTLTTAGILLCLTCARTIIVSSLGVHEHEIIIRVVSGLLAGIAVHFTATPTLFPGHGRRRHQIDDPRLITVFTLLSVYALFDVLLAQHIIWGIFPYIGWTTSFALQASQDNGEYRYSDRRERRSGTESSQSRRESADVINQRLRHGSRNNGGLAFNESSPSSRDARRPDAETMATKQASTAFRGSNNGGVQYNDNSERIKVYPSETTQLRKPRVGSSHVTFVDTVTHRHSTPLYKDVAKSSGETKRIAISGNGINPNYTRDVAPMEEVLPAPVFLLPLTRNNIRRVSQSPKHSDDGLAERLDRHRTVFSDENLSFHTPAESTFSDSDTDSDYTLARMTVLSGASSSTARAPLDFEEQFNIFLDTSAAIEDMGDDDLNIAEESSLDNDDVDNNALVLFNTAQTQSARVELRPNLIPQDYVSQTYVRVEKFVSAVDGTELAEQIEVVPGSPQENSYDKRELREQRRYLKDLLVYEPSETASSTTVGLSELEGNMRVIDQRAEEHRRKGLEAKRKVTALGEKRKNALNTRRSAEAFRIKCAMREYAKEADREDKKAAKLFFRARNRPGTSRVDVHLLKKEEALKVVENALREVQLKGGHQLHVIVGQGIHSANGKSDLKPFIKSMFEAQKMQVYESGSNPGILIINMK